MGRKTGKKFDVVVFAAEDELESAYLGALGSMNIADEFLITVFYRIAVPAIEINNAIAFPNEKQDDPYLDIGFFRGLETLKLIVREAPKQSDYALHHTLVFWRPEVWWRVIDEARS